MIKRGKRKGYNTRERKEIDKACRGYTPCSVYDDKVVVSCSVRACIGRVLGECRLCVQNR